MKKDASFWSDIKSLDERLKKDPESFCFARLSEIYLKVGLVADALHTARTGVAKHPGYLAGQRALGMACNASGLQDECRTTLELVTAAMPEDVDAQKILAGLYLASGDHESAIRVYETVLEFRPDDRVCSAGLESLQQSAGTFTGGAPDVESTAEPVAVAESGEVEDEDEIIELSEYDVYEETEEEPVAAPFQAAVESETASSDQHDPLSTLTLAQLYEKQGFIPKALEIYRTILADDPSNAQLLAKVAELEGGSPVVESMLEDELLEESDDELEFPEEEAFEAIPPILQSEFAAPAADHVPESIETAPFEAVGESTEPDFESETVAFDSSASDSGADFSTPVAEFSADSFETSSFDEVAEVAEVAEQSPDFAVETLDATAVDFETETAAFDTGLSAEAFDTDFSSSGTFVIPTPEEAQEFVEPVAESDADGFEPEAFISPVQESAPRTLESASFAPLANKAADNVVETLDGWLENIRRIKACR